MPEILRFATVRFDSLSITLLVTGTIGSLEFSLEDDPEHEAIVMIATMDIKEMSFFIGVEY
jgi:hypothetical protein